MVLVGSMDGEVMKLFNVWLSTASIVDLLNGLLTINEALCEAGGLGEVCGWRIRSRGGYYSMRKRISGRVREIYIGKNLTADTLAVALERGREMEAENG